MYNPPSREGFDPQVVKYKSISYRVDSVSDNDDDVCTRPNKVMIFFLHGNSQDIKRTHIVRLHLLEQLEQRLPRRLQGVCDIKCVTIDYPTFGMSSDDRSLLGTRGLDDQISELFELLCADEHGMNIVWSYSIGTRYASALVRRDERIDFSYMQAPFYSMPISSAHLFGGYWTGIEGQGLCVLHSKYNIFLHLAEYDEFFPPVSSLDLMKKRANGYIVQKGKSHEWFETLDAAEFGATIIGEEIGKHFLREDATLATIQEGTEKEDDGHVS